MASAGRNPSAEGSAPARSVHGYGLRKPAPVSGDTRTSRAHADDFVNIHKFIGIPHAGAGAVGRGTVMQEYLGFTAQLCLGMSWSTFARAENQNARAQVQLSPKSRDRASMQISVAAAQSEILGTA